MKLSAGNLSLALWFTLLLSAFATAQTTGAVYVNSNSASNAVWAYTRASDGTLTFAGTYDTQGAGSGVGNLSSQGAIILNATGKLLFVVNAGSNEITAFRVQRPGKLVFANKISSGGVFPTSLAIFGNLLYVLNAGTTAHINAFRVTSAGVMTAISNSARKLSASAPRPGQVGFSPDGKVLVVPEIDTDKIDTYTVATNGRATGPIVQDSAGAGPFGYAFDNAGHLIVSEVGLSSASSYSLDDTGTLSVITGALVDFGKAACWTITTNNPNFPQQYAYITNTASATISGFAIGSDGTLALLNSDGKTFVLPQGADPLDMAISSDSNYFYALEGKFGGIVGFQIQPDGSLIQVTNPLGTPTSSYGLTGN